MDEKRREITLEEVAQAQREGNNFVLENIRAEGTAVVRDKDGNVIRKLRLSDATDHRPS